jgi:type IV secretory pathway TraG/TraD family ATPase VirD4
MLQKLILVRVMQIIKARDRLTQHAPTCIVLDEFKHMLSPTAFTSLWVVRDFDTHILLAHQSLGDLSACPGIETVEAFGAVVDNTAIKIIYKIGDDDYAERLSRLSGKRRTYVDNSSKQLDERGVATGSWREEGVHHIDMDLMTHLPMPNDRPGQASVGVLFGVGNAQVFHVGPIPVSGNMPSPVIAVPYGLVSDVEVELI